MCKKAKTVPKKVLKVKLTSEQFLPQSRAIARKTRDAELFISV